MSSQKSKILHFDVFLLSKSHKVSANRVPNIYLFLHQRLMQSLKKNWLAVSNMIWEIWWIFTKQLKSLKISFQWALFDQSIEDLSYKKPEEISFMSLSRDTNMDKPWPCGFKNGMGKRVNFH